VALKTINHPPNHPFCSSNKNGKKIPQDFPGLIGTLVIKKKNILLFPPIRFTIIYVLITLKTSPFNNWNNERFE
jgi:hypothetical protein